jgi:alpha-mannosidase
VLLHQFHDILPGSSIAWVHQEAEAAYADVKIALEGIIAQASAAMTVAAQAPWVLNAAPHARAEVVTVDADVVVHAPEAQPLSTGQVAVYAAARGSSIAPLGQVAARGDGPDPVRVTDRVLDNGLVRVELDDDGLLRSVLDLASGREVLPPARRANVLQLHPDLPNEWDAWDIDQHYRRRHVDLVDVKSITTVEIGPLVGEIRVTRAFGASRLAQTIRLRAGSRRIDFVTDIEWHESEKILKAAFPLDVHADRSAAEIQFGHVFRPTHANTSWDAARFEIYAHRWIHVAEAGFGVAVLNDSTYGHDITRVTRDDDGTTTTVRLSLVRAPHCPDPHADQGSHRLTYSLLPAASIADAVAEGYALNLPLRVAAPTRGTGDATAAAPPPALVTVDNPAVVVEAIKLADDRSGDVVVRLYESLGGRATATVRAGFPLAGAETVDLLERPMPDSRLSPPADDALTIQLRPFQILTLRLSHA